MYDLGYRVEIVSTRASDIGQGVLGFHDIVGVLK